MEIQVNDDNFKKEVLGSEELVLVDFGTMVYALQNACSYHRGNRRRNGWKG